MRLGRHLGSLLLGLGLLLTACSSDEGGYEGISDQQEANLLDTCLATTSEPQRCAAWIAGLVEAMEGGECSYADTAKVVELGLTAKQDRDALGDEIDELGLSCDPP